MTLDIWFRNNNINKKEKRGAFFLCNFSTQLKKNYNFLKTFIKIPFEKVPLLSSKIICLLLISRINFATLIFFNYILIFVFQCAPLPHPCPALFCLEKGHWSTGWWTTWLEMGRPIAMHSSAGSANHTTAWLLRRSLNMWVS